MSTKKLMSSIKRKLLLHEEATDEEEDCGPKSSKARKLHGNQNAIKGTRKIEFGWYHNGSNVRKINGGGTRGATMQKSANKDDILREAKRIFFPDGQSRKGLQESMCSFSVRDFTHSDLNDMTLGEFAQSVQMSGVLRYYLHTQGPGPKLNTTITCSDSLDEMRQLDSRVETCSADNGHNSTHPLHSAKLPSQTKLQDSGPSHTVVRQMMPSQTVCNLPSDTLPQEVLHSQTVPGQNLPEEIVLADSPTHQTLRIAKEKPFSQAGGLVLVSDGEVVMQGYGIDIKYSRELESSYSEVISRHSTFTRTDCVMHDGNEGDLSESDPLQNGYVVEEISKEDGQLHACFVQRRNGTYEFPMMDTAVSGDDYLILHHPTEVWGYNEGNLILAVVSPLHNHAAVSYNWFRNGESVYDFGCVLVVKKPGTYYCHVKALVSVDNLSQVFERDSEVVHIVRVPCETLRFCLEDKAPNASPNTDDSLTPIDISELTFDQSKPIDHGAFGEVFAGTFRSTPVAIKRIKAKQGKRPDKLISKESSIHKTVSHPNIVKFVGTCFDNSHVYMVTELVVGRNMEDVIYSHDVQLNMDEKINISLDVLRGVAYLHEHIPQIIHQDIKPANILISAENNSTKLCDLGLAKMKSFHAVSTTQNLQVAGTLEYMAPERVLQHARATTSSDVWSLAITLGEFFSGNGVWGLQEQDDEPLLYLQDAMKKKQIPPGLRQFTLLLPCVAYEQSLRPSATSLLKRFECPTCSDLLKAELYVNK